MRRKRFAFSSPHEARNRPGPTGAGQHHPQSYRRSNTDGISGVSQRMDDASSPSGPSRFETMPIAPYDEPWCGAKVQTAEPYSPGISRACMMEAGSSVRLPNQSDICRPSGYCVQSDCLYVRFQSTYSQRV